MSVHIAPTRSLRGLRRAACLPQFKPPSRTQYWGEAGWFKVLRGSGQAGGELQIESDCYWATPTVIGLEEVLGGQALGDYISGVSLIGHAAAASTVALAQQREAAAAAHAEAAAGGPPRPVTSVIYRYIPLHDRWATTPHRYMTVKFRLHDGYMTVT